MVNPKTRAGRLSDLVTPSPKINWPALRVKIGHMEPGDVLVISVPPGADLKKFRSTILVSGGRIHIGEWRLSTRTKERKLHCFLSPR